MLVVRDARPRDLDALLAVARHLDTVNLPADRAVLAELIARSGASFAGALPVVERQYLFVLCDRADGDRVVGTSMIHAQHGTPAAPHVWFEVGEDERCSLGLGRRVAHRVLRIGYTFDGPTELGGLILLPSHRGDGRRAGKLLSYVRLLFLGARRAAFRDQVLAELLPPFEPDGSSRLWDSLGARFTGLSYAEADRRSRDDKEFIRSLFPEGPIYTCLLPPEAQALIGAVGPATRGVEQMLLAAGFRHVNRIDPFDGGPHLMARTDELGPVRGRREVTLREGAGETWTLLLRDDGDGVVATAAGCRVDGDVVHAPAEVVAMLGRERIQVVAP